MANETDARLGILMLDTRFPRILGDVGHAGSWDFPVRYAVVPGATPEAIVCDDIDPFVQAFIAVGRDLIAEGCTGIATTCGFLALIRPRLAEALGVPVAASALEQAGQIAACLPPGQRVGILTISAATLSPAHLRAAGVPEGSPVVGMEGSGLARTILGNLPDLDVAQARAEMVQAAQQLVETHADVGAILLECTNMVPYAPDIAAATGRPVHSIHNYLNWFHSGLLPPRFG
ncbi:aspartate/glutamate racemase family protein [Sulfitobacter faviae]|uniref:Aspartate/glutamate racemase family protein n=1 Tax=Sulfitobacter faviae TaxID=1775881 RepID=A0ABZ0UZI6_9RHOB|nr:aspartate/glutamate racemase family protein [Sulfitobacter faviae]WPZ21631.1 aspartate/glutamate racemase family protein [Sulfitobacter faviae]